MYESFYGLTGKPFQLNPDPQFYFGSKQHRRAQAYLEYGMHQNEGFIVVTGDVGAGKTTIVRNLLESLDAERVEAAHLVSTQLDAEDILSMVAAAFGVRAKGASKSDLLMSLEAFLMSAATRSKRCLLIVDEAQNLTQRAVEELRMLSNFQLGTQSVLQTFLIGQPEFRAILQSPDMVQLRQRIIASCHISPMDREETQGYIEHRLHCVGAKDKPAFDAGAFDAIFAASGGVPRRINALCDRLLLSGYLAGKTAFTREDADSVAAEIEDEVFARSAVKPRAVEVEEPRFGDIPDLPADAVASLSLDDKSINEASTLLSALHADQLGSRLRRLERSLLRLERINSATLVLLQKLVQNAQAQPRGE
ncbi:MAG: AAA family ATPase [Rhodocyclaceae bacterium]|nr:AAA family ATPase [Rhodocyclaceae bacterium]